MKTSWTKGLEPDSKKELELQFKASTIVRKRLKELLEDKWKVEDNKRLQSDSYDTPNWAFKQADIAGYHRALREIISLLEE